MKTRADTADTADTAGSAPLARADRIFGRLGILVACLSGPPTAHAEPPAVSKIHWVNSIGMRFVQLPAGVFLMGSDEDPSELARDFPQLEPSRFTTLADEAPVHRVHISKSFWLGQHEVTVGQFRRFIELSGHVPESVADGTGAYGFDAARAKAPQVDGDAFVGRSLRWSWADPGFAQDDSHPVVNVTWNDAVAMARWLGEHEGRSYRLPREAEWEYACRAGSRTRYSSGNQAQTLNGQANLFDQDSATNWPRWHHQALSFQDGWAFTAPVGSFAANAFGLHDMHGNVWEWVADFHADDYYHYSPDTDPTGPMTGHLRVRRGGSWHSWPFYARCSYRNWNSPQTRYTLVGFRLMLEAIETPDRPSETRMR